TLGGPAPLAGSACSRSVTATATLNVGPTARSVAFNYALVGQLADQALGELCYAGADVALDGNQIIGYSPLPVGQLTPCVPGACVPLPVNQPARRCEQQRARSRADIFLRQLARCRRAVSAREDRLSCRATAIHAPSVLFHGCRLCSTTRATSYQFNCR